MSANPGHIQRMKRLGILALALTLVLPLLTIWNLYALPHAPKWRVMIGPRLHGVTEPETPVDFSLRTFADGSWQKFAATAVSEAYPLRPLLIRANNYIRLKLFGAYAAPGILTGDNAQLIAQDYLDEYCTRNKAKLQAEAREWIPKLKELQDYYEAHGRVFIYLITPSKAAYMPENFFPRLRCAAAEPDRIGKLPVYGRLLAEAGVHVVDAASLTHSLKGKYKVDLFPRGGIHWNAIGVANAANAVVREINRLERREAAPKLEWDYVVTHTAEGEDRDLTDLLNVLRPNVNYETAKVTYDPTLPCEAYPASTQKVAIIGGSFIAELAKVLVKNACLSKLEGYNYLYRGSNAGTNYQLVRRRLTADDIRPLREADVVILEENESAVPGTPHAREFYRVILGK